MTMKTIELNFLTSDRATRKTSDMFGKNVKMVISEKLTAYFGVFHESVIVSGVKVIIEDGTVIHDMGTHSTAISAGKRYLTKEMQRKYGWLANRA